MPAIKMNSDALTRVMCEYWPSGVPSVSGLKILMSAKLLSQMVAGRLDAAHRTPAKSRGARKTH
jgi:hypothetical protein